MFYVLASHCFNVMFNFMCKNQNANCTLHIFLKKNTRKRKCVNKKIHIFAIDDKLKTFN